MQHDVGSQPGDRLVDRIAIGDVEGGVGGGDDVVALGLAVDLQVAAQLAAGAGDEDLHGRVPGAAQACPARSFSGRHHHSLALYQATVSSRASSRVRRLVQPRLVILSMFTEYRRSWPSRSVT